MRPGRPSSITDDTREAILDARAAGLTAPQIALQVRTPVSVVRYAILAARRRGDPRAAGLPPGSPSSITLDKREAILDGWASGRTAPQLANELGTNDGIVRNVVSAARREGDPRAAHRNPGAAWRPEPVRYASSNALLEALLKQARERSAAWERTEMGRRMRAIAVPPPDER